MKKKLTFLMLMVILCYLGFGISMHTESNCRVLGSVSDQMYTIEQQFEICDANTQIKLTDSGIGLLVMLCLISVPFMLVVSFSCYRFDDSSFYLIYRDSLVSKKVQLND